MEHLVTMSYWEHYIKYPGSAQGHKIIVSGMYRSFWNTRNSSTIVWFQVTYVKPEISLYHAEIVYGAKIMSLYVVSGCKTENSLVSGIQDMSLGVYLFPLFMADVYCDYCFAMHAMYCQHDTCHTSYKTLGLY